LDYLGSLPDRDNKPLLSRDFLQFLKKLRFECDVDGVPEGTVVFPQEPLLRVRGPIVQAQLVETALLNFLNFETLIATKAARVCVAAEGDRVIEFGLRRAQGMDGGLSASRAAFVGGCAATSNLLAGRTYGIPVAGTHAHSWVMSFRSELEAFRAYANAMPANCIFLVDTYDSLEGVRNAVKVGKEMRQRGHELAGVRLDSGDLAWLSIQARAILDEAGFPQASIVASNDLDERIITSLKQQGAKIDTWGVGTRLVTAFDQPALGGVYKLSAIRGGGGRWVRKMKYSDQSAKVTNPGVLNVRRFAADGEFVGDAIYDVALGLRSPVTIIDPADPARRKVLAATASDSKGAGRAGQTQEDLLVPVFRKGKLVYRAPALKESRGRAAEQLKMLHAGIKRLVNPHRYPAGLERRLYGLREKMMRRRR
jgi:nicotinate phosphoribosyltransferase